MTIQEIKTIQISDFLSNKGYEPISKKGNKWWYLSPLRSEHTASFKVDTNKNLWYDFGLGGGGNILDLAMELYHTNNIPEVLRMMSHSTVIPVRSSQPTTRQEPAPFEDIEVRELAHPALLSYLSTRGINSDIGKSLCVEMHYKSNGKNYFAVGFRNDAGGYELRNPYFKGCIAPKEITTITSHEAECHVFEGFIDYLSYLILYGKCEAVVLNSIVNIPHAIPILSNYSQVFCHLDNDAAGRKGTQQIIAGLGNKCVDAANEYSGYKDFNEYLVSKRLKQEGRENQSVGSGKL